MMASSVEKFISATPESLIGESRFVRHFFYGSDSKIRQVRRKIKDGYDNATFNMDSESMVVTIDSIISENTLTPVIENMEKIAELYGVEYDGFEVSTEDLVTELKPFDPFTDFFSPGSYVRLKLSNNKFGYLLFVGGNAKDSLFFDCIATVDDGNCSAKCLDEAPRLYRQPIQGIFDPHKCEFVGKSNRYHLPTKISFRLSYGHPSPEELDEIAREYGFQVPLADEDWLPLLKKVVESGRKIISTTSTGYIAYLDANNKVKWSEEVKIMSDQSDSPMLFGSFARYEIIDAVLTGGLDEIALLDRAY